MLPHIVQKKHSKISCLGYVGKRVEPKKTFILYCYFIITFLIGALFLMKIFTTYGYSKIWKWV